MQLYTGAILENGLTTFTPILNQLGNMVDEFTPYIVGIGVGVLSFSLVIRAVKWIVGYFSGKAKSTIRGR